MKGSGFSIRAADWAVEEEAIRAVRETVFVVEQDVPVDLEWDGLDPECVHLLAVDEEGRPVGTARMLADGKIGRMAVTRAWRGRGIGTALLERLLEVARERGIRTVLLDAQVRAMGFYSRLGFRPFGEEFMDAGIPHKKMVLDLHAGS